EVEGRWQSNKGYASVTVSRDTVCRRLDGGWSCHQVNMEMNTWLIEEEEEQLITFCVELASQGFPLNHQALKLHVNAILHTRLGTSFPEAGVGTNWTQHFLERHTAHLASYWSVPLDTAHGRAVNKHTNTAWFDLLGKTIAVQKIEEDCLWAADETGFQPGGGLRQ
ncbi:hypothetical protein PAXRUDRAFT_135622, partial [Paxillus rubicundulus Ve08.2h10]